MGDPVICYSYQTQFGNNYGYLSEDGRYLFMGSLIDLKQGQNLTDIDNRKTVKSEISRLAIRNNGSISRYRGRKGSVKCFYRFLLSLL